MRRKSKFLTFCFSWLPGAGYMHMGFMKKGVSMMALFFGTIGVISVTGFEILGLVIPVIWFYAFFDQLNIMGMQDKFFYCVEDEYFISIDKVERFYHKHLRRFRKEIALALIVLGLYELLQTTAEFIFSGIPVLGELLYQINYRVPQILAAGIIILIGLRMIGGKKRELEDGYYDDGLDREPQPEEHFSYEEPVSRAAEMAAMFNEKSNTMDTVMYGTEGEQDPLAKSFEDHSEEQQFRQKTAEETYVNMAADLKAMDEAIRPKEETISLEFGLSEDAKAKMKAAIAGSEEHVEL